MLIIFILVSQSITSKQLNIYYSGFYYREDSYRSQDAFTVSGLTLCDLVRGIRNLSLSKLVERCCVPWHLLELVVCQDCFGIFYYTQSFDDAFFALSLNLSIQNPCMQMAKLLISNIIQVKITVLCSLIDKKSVLHPTTLNIKC